MRFLPLNPVLDLGEGWEGGCTFGDFRSKSSYADTRASIFLRDNCQMMTEPTRIKPTRITS